MGGHCPSNRRGPMGAFAQARRSPPVTQRRHLYRRQHVMTMAGAGAIADDIIGLVHAFVANKAEDFALFLEGPELHPVRILLNE